MRKFICDEKACVLEPSHQNQSGSGCVKTYNEMSGGSVGLDPVESTFYIPLKQIASAGLKASAAIAKRRNLTGSGPLKKIQKKPTKKKKSQSRTKSPRIRIKQFGAGQTKKRKCVKNK